MKRLAAVIVVLAALVSTSSRVEVAPDALEMLTGLAPQRGAGIDITGEN